MTAKSWIVLISQVADGRCVGQCLLDYLEAWGGHTGGASAVVEGFGPGQVKDDVERGH